MLVELLIPVKAKAKNKHYEKAGIQMDDLLEVEAINMGQTSTRVCFWGRNCSFNALHFDFYVNGKEIDIYRSGAFNHYFMFRLPLIKFVGDET